MRRPLRQKGGQRVTRPTPVMAPVKGWVQAESLEAMDPQTALDLINWFPRERDVVSRKGYTAHCDTGTGERVDDILPYSNGATRKLLAVSDGSIFDVTTSTAVELETGLSGTEYVTAKLGGNMVIVNGVDEPMIYDGSTIASHSFQAADGFTLDTTKLNYVFTYRGRLFFVEAGTQSIWYGGLGAISGDLNKFDLSLVQSLDGEAMILTSLTRDGGEGTDDLFVIVMSDGDTLTYSGSDPGVAADWSKVGSYQIGAPLSRRAHVMNGATVEIATHRGYENLERSMVEGEGVRVKNLFSAPIQPGVLARTRSAGARSDWRSVLYTRGRMMIVQVPINDEFAHYHVRNIDTQRWTRFGLDDAYSWGILSRRAYVGDRNGVVHLFDEGDTDNGADIVLTADTAWNPLGSRGLNKQIHYLKVSLTGIYFPDVKMSLAVDFGAYEQLSAIDLPPQSPPAYFGEANFGSAYFSHGVRTQQYQHKANGFGRMVSMRIAVLWAGGGG